MMANHKLAGAIGDVAWASFVTMLEYKAEWYGKNILRIGRFEPSSKTCSVCGTINKELSLSDREWICSCGSILNRDVNAAINIKIFALKNLNVSRTDTQTCNELPCINKGVLTYEAHPPLGKG